MRPLTFRGKPITLKNIRNYIIHIMRKNRRFFCPAKFEYHWKYIWCWDRKFIQSFADKDGYFSDKTDRINKIANILADDKSKYIYISVIKFRKSMNLFNVPMCMETERQYFLNDLNLSTNETFIDCGGFIGDTIDAFIEHCRDFNLIVSFEPDTQNFIKLKDKYGNHSKVKLINAGVYDEEKTIKFYKDAISSRSHITDNEKGVVIDVKRIDDLELEKITFIKMDVEGAELRALKGAEKTILRDKPKLAICIYHKPEDFVEIPEYLHTLIPEYKFYVRQYSIIQETVLYATL